MNGRPSLAYFQARQGQAFGMPEYGAVTLALIAVSGHPGPAGAIESYALLFRGPAQPVLEQRIHRLVHEGDELAIFLVPVGRDDRGIKYEAIFN